MSLRTVPTLTEIGSRHPVTAGIASGIERAGPWYRIVETVPRSGQTLMAGTYGLPLLALDRVEEGRIGVLASEHAWLWSRGHGGGGPHRELFRRIAHWLMREPDLEEEALRASEMDGALVVSRRTLEEEPAQVHVLDPEGRESIVELEGHSPRSLARRGRGRFSRPLPVHERESGDAGDCGRRSRKRVQ